MSLTAQEIQLIRDSGLFDAEWYAEKYPDVGIVGLDPLEHFLRIGIYIKRNPCLLFDCGYYLSQFEGFITRPENPLLDYLQEGWRQHRNPHPLFDLAWYFEKNEDIRAAGIEPLAHFRCHGGLEGRQPHPAFPTYRVLERCPWLRELQCNPLEYYLSKGWAEDPCPEATAYLSLCRAANPSNHAWEPPAKTLEHIPREKIHVDAQAATDIRAIAIYLPQFHAIPENDEWWGKGFTEWTNVRRATPQYEGHYQPHVPHPDIGYYDINDASVLEKQAAMARAAGIEGFCFYYYWFNGRRLLNMPTDRLLATGKPDFPFCFCWANENWTRAWDGGDKEILIGQDHSHESDERFIIDLLPAFRDPRYIRVECKPLLIVYRPCLLPDPAATVRHWRETCRREGIGEIFLAFLVGFESPEPGSIGFDTAIQMPPLRCGVPVVNNQLDLHDPERFAGDVRDYRHAVASLPFEDFGPSFWPAVCPSWDNTARRMERGHSWIHSSPEIYHRWLSIVAHRARQALPPQQRFVFINAWNEWAEGCHLEPDEKFGYAWLNATRLALAEGVPRKNVGPQRKTVLVVGHDAFRAGAQAVLLTMLAEWKVSAACDFRLVLLGDGALRPDFEALCPTLVLSGHASEAARTAALEAFCQPRPDVVLANSIACGPFLPHLQRLGAPVTLYVHELQKSIERWAPGPMMRATVESSDHFIAVSNPVADNLQRNHGIPAKKISTLNPYIPTRHRVSRDLLDSLRSEVGVRARDKTVFGCGTVDWRKGPDLFVETALEVLKKIPEARFFWIGCDGGDDAAARAHRLATDSRIRFLGERKNPRDYFALADAFFLSSREDPFPLVALEAADAALPVVCFADAGGMAEFVGNEHGRAVSFGDVHAAAAALVELLSDGESRKSLGLAAQAAVRAKHDSVQGAAAVLSVLEKVGAAGGKAPRQKKKPVSVRGKPLVTVILPNYNHAPFLNERLESILAQGIGDMEILLLDDCSSDVSPSILRDFCRREPRARLLANSRNSGSTFHQWKKGFAEARGQFVWIAESDDSAEPELLRSLLVLHGQSGNTILCYAQSLMVDLCGRPHGPATTWTDEIDPERWKGDYIAPGLEELRTALCVKNTIPNVSAVLFRNSPVLREVVEDSMKLCADWLSYVRLCAHGEIGYCHRPLNRWRLASSNARTKPPGETEWEEGSRIYDEIGGMLAWSEQELAMQRKRFREKCEKWRQAA